ncbi:hypothetical protein C1646_674190 [Rhizophagus diaphanus]|nr:hypothetical protein C1646_674190 [Rhizophagus diaphanus] [Rhizophagus sp. MUCL 43196]
MVTDQNHLSDVSSEQEVIGYTKKLAKLLGLYKQKLKVSMNRLQNTKVNSVLSNDNYLDDFVDELLAIGQCNCSKKSINTSSKSSSSESSDSDSDIDELVKMIKHQRIREKIWERQAQRKDSEEKCI